MKETLDLLEIWSDFVLGLSWRVLPLLVLIWEIRPIIRGFKGGNGMWAIDEVSKVGIFLLLYYMVDMEGKRQHEWMLFPVSLYILLVFALLLMAQLGQAIELFIKFIAIWKGQRLNEDDLDIKEKQS